MDIHISPPPSPASTRPRCSGRMRKRRHTHLRLGVTHVLQSVGDKSYKGSTTCHFTNDARWSSVLGRCLLTETLLCLRSLTGKEEAQRLLGILEFLRKHILHIGILLIPMSWVTWKAASVEWRSEQGRALWQVQAVTHSPSAWTIQPGRA